MKTAEYYYNEFIRLEGSNKDDFTYLINEARKEAIIECSKRAKINEATNNWQETWIDKQSVLSLIDELK